MAISKKVSDMTLEFIRLARKKNYREETIELLIMLCFAKQMAQNYGSYEKALEKLLEFCKETENSQDCLEKVCELMKLD